MTHEEFVQKVKEKLGDDYLVLGKYVRNSEKIKMKHLVCNHVYEPLAMTLTRKKPCKCPSCYGTPKKTTDKFKKEVDKIVGNEYEVIGEYKDNKTKIKILHNKCKKDFDILPKDFLKGHRCSHCYKSSKKTTEDFKKEVYELVLDEYTVLGEYKTTNTKIEMKHNLCNKTWEIRPNNFLNLENRCPHCKKLESKSIRKIKKILKENNIEFECEKTFEDCKYKRKLPFDIFIPSLNLFIEYDGEQHFRPVYSKESLALQRLRDRIKNKWVSKNNYSIIRIDYTMIKYLDDIILKIIEGSSTTISRDLNLFYIESGGLINDNEKYLEIKI